MVRNITTIIQKTILLNVNLLFLIYLIRKAVNSINIPLSISIHFIDINVDDHKHLDLKAYKKI